MATYAELFDLKNDSALRNKIAAACSVAADTIRLESAQTANHTNRLKWAKEAFENPEKKAEQVIWAVLATNRAATSGQISGAADADILTAVNAVIDIFAVG